MPKKGRLTNKEKTKIVELHDKGLSIDEIAKELDRLPETIMEITGNIGLDPKNDIVKKTWWPQIQEQFNKQEQRYFQDSYNEIKEQFGNDVLKTEELQIKEYISLELLRDRVLVDRKKALESKNHYEDELEQQLDQDKDDRDRDRINFIQGKLEDAAATLKVSTKEYNALTEKANKTLEALKGTRNERIKTVADSSKTFANLIKALSDIDYREKVGREMEVMRELQRQYRNFLRQPMVYDDGSIDSPILIGDEDEDDDIRPKKLKEEKEKEEEEEGNEE